MAKERKPDVQSVRFSNTDDQAIVTGDGKHIKGYNADNASFDVYWEGHPWLSLESKPEDSEQWTVIVPLNQVRFMRTKR